MLPRYFFGTKHIYHDAEVKFSMRSCVHAFCSSEIQRVKSLGSQMTIISINIEIIYIIAIGSIGNLATQSMTMRDFCYSSV